jgi:mRNA interferase RelE/StbE
MPWFRVAYRPLVVEDLAKVDQGLAQRLFDKTKWLASNINNLRHELLDVDLPGLSQYAVGDWRIVYSIDKDEQVLDVHLIGTSTEVYKQRVQ